MSGFFLSERVVSLTMTGHMDTPLRLFPPNRAHYEVLDGLRGVAAILVVCFHLFEAHATSHFNQMLNHTYLAVDFFFVLSGFVIGYAYDGRWGKGGLSAWAFICRRLIRLQPMIVFGTLLGLAVFPFTFGPEGWVENAPLPAVLLCALLGALMIPITPALDVRGWDENYPLNGSQWSLFFEYAANLLYAFVFRFLPTRWLALATLAAAGLSAWYVGNSPMGDYHGGWALTPAGLETGFCRVLFTFMAGLLLSRLQWKLEVPKPFLTCGLLLALVLAMPRLGTETELWPNAVYEAACVLLVFPLIVIMGSSGLEAGGADSGAICRFCGRISYPLYLVQFPIALCYMKYVHSGQATAWSNWGWGIAAFIAAVSLAAAVEKYYDRPVRKWLGQL